MDTLVQRLMHALRTGKIAMDASFSESDHPRSGNGQFGSGGSGKSDPKTESGEVDIVKKFPKNSKVRENRQGAPTAQVVMHRHPMLILSNGQRIHHTKAVRV